MADQNYVDMRVDPLMRVRNLSKVYHTRTGFASRATEVRALDRISFDVQSGETLGIVGESGCGKSTLARILMKLEEPSDGSVVLDGENIFKMSRRESRRMRGDVQIVFQDSSDSLSPRQRISQIIDEPLRLHTKNGSKQRRAQAAEIIDLVGLPKSVLEAHPHELSGGQRQRVAIARALSVRPKVLICDEPTSALDVSVQAQVMDLLKSLRLELGLTYIFISHNLDLVQEFSSRVLVMYLGQIVEATTSDILRSEPIHPYSEGLLASTLIPSPRLQRERRASIILGEIPSPSDPPSGCRFHPRCPKAKQACVTHEPELIESVPEDLIACHDVNSPEIMVGNLINPVQNLLGSQ